MRRGSRNHRIRSRGISRRVRVIGIAILAISSIPSIPLIAKIDWPAAPILDEALATASKTRTPLFVVFEADWCGWCRKLERETLASGPVQEAAKRYLPLRFDLDTSAGAAAARRFGVVGLPTLLILDPDGQIVERIVGLRDTQELAATLEKTALKVEPVDALLAELERAGAQATPESLLRAGWSLLEGGHENEAYSLLERASASAPAGSLEYSRALMGLAAIAKRRGDRDAALPLLARAAKEATDSQAARETFTSYIALLREMKSKEQSRVWDEYAARLPGDPTVQEDYARALIELSAPAEKILSAAETAAKLSPGAGGPQACRAQALFALRRWAEALEAVNVAIQLNPDDTAPRVLRLRILEKLQAKSG